MILNVSGRTDIVAFYTKVKNNMKRHDPNSSLLIGQLETDDIIKERIK